jgi:hypothetical protein
VNIDRSARFGTKEEKLHESKIRPIRSEAAASLGEMLMRQLVHNHPKLEGASGGNIDRELQDA